MTHQWVIEQMFVGVQIIFIFPSERKKIFSLGFFFIFSSWKIRDKAFHHLRILQLTREYLQSYQRNPKFELFSAFIIVTRCLRFSTVIEIQKFLVSPGKSLGNSLVKIPIQSDDPLRHRIMDTWNQLKFRLLFPYFHFFKCRAYVE